MAMYISITVVPMQRAISEVVKSPVGRLMNMKRCYKQDTTEKTPDKSCQRHELWQVLPVIRWLKSCNLLSLS